MKRIITSVFGIICVIGVANAASFLSAQKFPKTFNDLSFEQRMAVLSEGFEPFESEYDANGQCISNCAYPGITIEEDIARDDERTKNALERANKTIANAQNTSQPTMPQTTYQPNSVPITNTQSATFPQNPLGGKPLVVTSPFGRRNVTGGSVNHQAIDMRAPIGTPVYATADGTVSRVTFQGEKNGKFGCGKYIEIKHNNGYKTQYCHLSEQLVSVGQNVSAGTLIGKSGNTGGTNMTPHLHYMVYDMNGNPDAGAVNPVAFLLPGTWQCKPDVASHKNCSAFQNSQYRA